MYSLRDVLIQRNYYNASTDYSYMTNYQHVIHRKKYKTKGSEF